MRPLSHSWCEWTDRRQIGLVGQQIVEAQDHPQFTSRADPRRQRDRFGQLADRQTDQGQRELSGAEHLKRQVASDETVRLGETLRIHLQGDIGERLAAPHSISGSQRVRLAFEHQRADAVGRGESFDGGILGEAALLREGFERTLNARLRHRVDVSV